MTSNGPNLKAHEENLNQHHEIRVLLARIDATLQRPSSGVDEISDLLAQLGDRLIKHFAFEEDGGYFGEALLHAPQLISKANALLAQHPRIRTQATNMVSDLKSLDPSSEQWRSRTAELFRAFRDELLRHEQQENILLQQAYQQDLGTTD